MSPYSEVQMVRIVDHAFTETGKAIDGIRDACDRGLIMRKLLGYRIVATTPERDPAFIFTTQLIIDGNASGIGIEVVPFKDAMLVVDGAPHSTMQEVWPRIIEGRM